MAFAPDIAQGLLNEIRKLQQVIQEKDRLIMDLEINKADKEKDQEVTQKHLRQKARVEGKIHNSIPLSAP
jgi:GTPase involved in cell partitioning and DNA repair